MKIVLSFDGFTSFQRLFLRQRQWRLYQARWQGQSLSSVADVIQLHRTEHAREVLIAACREAIATGNVESVVERFINSSQVAA